MLDQYIAALGLGIILIPRLTWAGELVHLPYKEPNNDANPALFIVETYELRFEPTDTGRGNYAGTVELTPGEKTGFRLHTWRNRRPRSGEAIVDSLSAASAQRFETLAQLTTQHELALDLRNIYEPDVHTNAAHRGMLHLSASPALTEPLGFHAARQGYVRSLVAATERHLDEANACRQTVVVPSQHDANDVTGRITGNTNLRNTLRFDVHEVDQLYDFTVKLVDVRVGFSNGRLGSWREAPLTGAVPFLEKLLGNPRQMLRLLMRTAARAFDEADKGTTVEQAVAFEPPYVDYQVTDFVGDADGLAAEPTRRLVYRNRGEVELAATTVRMRTDSARIYATLGSRNALDEYALDLQRLDITSREVQTSQVSTFVAALEAIADPEQRAAAYAAASRPDGFTLTFPQP
ncbi:hypothetical protein [Arthrobacter sp. ISL-72]|uniref:hypothetical protein n=1 Tax=Arthrobacter sp. ISL-72 TaxID=2819114 RepID=UPI001BE7278C|nr:hypothetical protein [Arthrobacter sp. ISL-72]MBT2597213.1 hypothetical protein [Arthrobacter sp. ISL-72]